MLAQTDISPKRRLRKKLHLKEKSAQMLAFINQLKLMFPDEKQGICMGEARVRAFLRMLRVGEGTVGEPGYTRLFGGDNFTESPHNKDLSNHPQIKVYWYTDDDGNKVHSSAAGAYQIMGYVWDDKKMINKRKEYGIKDFTPLSQDYFAVIILKYKRPDLIDLIIKNQIRKGLEDLASYEWASLPPGRYGQPAKSMKEALKLYNDYLKKELKGESDLHLPSGFLKKFGINCCSENTISDTDSIITIVRKWDHWTGNNSKSTTIGSFSISNSTIEGYIAEPYGEETAESGKDKRIPVGTYSLVWHTSDNFPLDKYVSKGQPILQNGFPKLYNDTVAQSRGILIHIGNTGKDSEGCLLPGSGLKEKNGDIVGNTGSTTKFYEIIDYIEEKGIENVKVVIKDEIN